METQTNFNFDTDEYIVEPSPFTFNQLVNRAIGEAFKAGKTPREF